MSVSHGFEKIRHLLLLTMMVFIWLILGMVWFDRFIPPFDRLVPWLTPWKGLFVIPAEAGLDERLSFMQGLLDASNRVAYAAFLTMVITFAVFSGYLTLVYQQKQRRARENKLLLIKNQEIARRNEFIRYISATIGHEFKNNLGRIKRRLNLLTELPQDVKVHLDSNLDKLFADIDIFKKISDEREALLIDSGMINLREMLISMSKQYSDLADIVFQSDIHTPTIFAAQALLKTVFENLIDNAIRYKKPEQSRAHILVSCSMDNDGSRRYVSLSFRDEGVGMDEQQSEQCFYKEKGSQERWGQGLYFAKYVVGLHAGKIRIGKEYTALGRGTEIIISLPFIEEAFNV